MVNFDGNVPGYLTIRMSAPDSPVAVLADVEAWTARESYPEILSAGAPVFGIAREREEGGWELQPPDGTGYRRISDRRSQ
ncbi:DUF5954 family protein [Kitasatospora azatica]|uniref:DUF5954 family protein n=1 Tax=Kitasatospora azatica TaxID=58347 RepID=UPI001E2DDA2E|nr:DUF5954 family protein [Kitasatospora azatica]